MCDTCPTHLLGPGEVAGKVARSKAGRKVGSVLFYGTVWTFGPPLVLGIIWHTLGWWLVPITAGLLALGGVVGLAVRVLHRHALVVAPASLRASLPAPRRAVALPRNLSITRGRRALPEPAKALPAPGVVVGRVVPAPVRERPIPSKVPDLSRVPLGVLPALGGDEGPSFNSSV